MLQCCFPGLLVGAPNREMLLAWEVTRKLHGKRKAVGSGVVWKRYATALVTVGGLSQRKYKERGC